MRKTTIIIFVILAVLVGVFFISRAWIFRKQAEMMSNLKTAIIEQDTLASSVNTSGIVRSNQSAFLFWQASGEVAQVFVRPGDQVTAGDILATLESHSLPAYILLAQVDLLSAQKALDDLYLSQARQAAALKAVDEAERALEDALNPELTRAQAQVEIAEAQKNLEKAQRDYEIITAIPSQSALDQAYANLLLAEDQLNQTRDTVADLEQQIVTAGIGLPAAFQSQIKQALRDALKGLQIKLTQDQLAYERSLARFNALLAPPDPLKVRAAEVELSVAKAQLEEAARKWERIKDGPRPSEIGVLEARLLDAQREWERVKDGPNPDDIALLETRMVAAQAIINTAHITAPFDGTITSVRTQANDRVALGTLAFAIDDISHLVVDANISQIDINQIEIGQAVLLTFDAIFAKEYLGKVIATPLVGTEMAGSTNFKVTIELIDPDGKIKPGMSSNVAIVVSQIENALLIPNQAIRFVNEEKVVFVVDRGILDGKSPLRNGIRPVPVVLGISSNNFSEVIAGGLSPGDEILLDPTDEIIEISQR